ncbi:MAG: hypothetical protein KDD70_01910 [Bdellovibrionales bacterium]|nr:hypothetical protein [Bdellovibrionales bacterium]
MALTSEQQELVDLVDKFFSSEIDDDYLRKRQENVVLSDPELWGKILELGFFEYFSEANSEENSVQLLGEIARASGRVPLPEALSENLLSGPLLLTSLVQGALKGDVKGFFGTDDFQGILDGRRTVAIVPPCYHEGLSVDEKGWLSGQLFGAHVRPDCCAFIVSVKESLYLAKLTSGVVPSAFYSSLDHLIPRSVYEVKELPTLELASVLDWKDLHRYVIGAEMLGLAERAVRMTCEFVGERKQFGVPVGCFQAVSHPLAEAYLKLSELEALYSFLGGMLDRKDPQRKVLSRVFLSAALSRVPGIIEKCIQLHGGIGFTWEYPLHLFLRRAKTYEALFVMASEEHASICELSLAL